MATITLKNIPDKIYDILKEEAKSNHRSLNGEILFALQQYIVRAKNQPSPEEILRTARNLRSKVNVHLTPEEVDAAKREGRL